MDFRSIKVRYGASVDIMFHSDEDTAIDATLYVGNQGQLPVITVPNTFIDGVADLSVAGSLTEIPLGDYYYQITVNYSDGRIKKFPEPTACSTDLPTLSIYEALDETEVIS